MTPIKAMAQAIYFYGVGFPTGWIHLPEHVRRTAREQASAALQALADNITNEMLDAAVFEHAMTGLETSMPGMKAALVAAINAAKGEG